MCKRLYLFKSAETQKFSIGRGVFTLIQPNHQILMPETSTPIIISNLLNNERISLLDNSFRGYKYTCLLLTLSKQMNFISIDVVLFWPDISSVQPLQINLSLSNSLNLRERNSCKLLCSKSEMSAAAVPIKSLNWTYAIIITLFVCITIFYTPML